ncbi:DUF998 domain-containing protein [Actinoplanes sp. NPDC024001]|uniref:DUF998 domain-containing protein n=1 Tax=Actinoplanes sp. NPDC024001 TaxID=3154598 RepID=UPI0033CC1355
MTNHETRGNRTAGKLRDVLQPALLLCGIGYGVFYVIANDLIATAMWDDYSRIDQAISELSGTGAPSQDFLTAVLPLFMLLMIGFGVGVWKAAGSRRALRLTGGVLVAQGLMFPVWLWFPMTSRETLAQGAGGANDVGHLVLSMLAVLFILAETGFSAAALGGRFRVFAIVMAVTVVLAGAFVAVAAPDVAAGGPTHWMGFVERISYGAWLLWMAVLALVLVRRTDAYRVERPVPGRRWQVQH